MGYPRQLVIIRHAQSLSNSIRKGGLFIPDNQDAERLKLIRPEDTPLTQLGILQADYAGGFLQGEYGEFDAVYCSPYKRTNQTLNGIRDCYSDYNQNLSKNIFYDPLIREIERGVIHNMTEQEARQYFPWFRLFPQHEWYKNPDARKGWFYTRMPGGGESYADVLLRVRVFLGELFSNHTNEKILLVTHGGVTRTIRMYLEKLTPNEFELDLLVWRFRNCGLVVYESNESGQLKLKVSDRVAIANKDIVH